MRVFYVIFVFIFIQPLYSQEFEVYELFPDTWIELNESILILSGYDNDYNFFEIEENYDSKKYCDFILYETKSNSFFVLKSDYWLFLLSKDGSIFHGAKRKTNDVAPTEGLYQRFGIFQSSSFLTEKLKDIEIQYNPERLLDWDITTGWVEGASGDGIGETLTFSLKHRSVTSSLFFYNGFIEPRNIDLYYKNARLKEFSLEVDSGEKYFYELEDKPDEQIIYLPERSNSFILTIISSYPGTKYSDLAINGIFASMRPDHYETKF